MLPNKVPGARLALNKLEIGVRRAVVLSTIINTNIYYCICNTVYMYISYAI